MCDTQDVFAVAARTHIPEAFTRMRAQKHSTKNEWNRSLQFETGCSKTRRIKNVKLSASQSRDKKAVRAYYDY